MSSSRKIFAASAGLLLVGGLIVVLRHTSDKAGNLPENPPAKLSPAASALRDDAIAEDTANLGATRFQEPARIGAAKKNRGQSALKNTAEAPLPSLEDVLDLENALPLEQRLAALWALDYTLSRADWEKLRDFLLKNAESPYHNASQLRYLKNEVMNAMVKGTDWLVEFADCMKQLCTDPRQDEGIQDYALQFVAIAAEQDARVGWKFHWEILDGRDENLAATASLHLAGAARRGELDLKQKKVLGKAALRRASDSSLPATNRATALNVCAALGIGSAEQIARRTCRDDTAPLVLRLAAIAALGELQSDAATYAYLGSLKTSENPHLSSAASAALEKRVAQGG